MRPIPTHDQPQFFKAITRRQLQIPFFGSLLKAGFPSPATDYVERVCDLNDLCIDHAEATYFVRVTGDSMTGDHIQPGDILIVDCSREALDGRIVVAWYNGEHTVKRIRHAPPLIVLEPSNLAYSPIYVQPNEDFKVFGVVTYVIHKTL